MIRSDHFNLQELVPPETYEKMGDAAWELFSDEAIQMIDGVRVFFNKPSTINNWMWINGDLTNTLRYRGYRPPECTVGAKGSMHRKGMAFDMDIKGISAAVARGMIIEHQDDPLLIHITRMEADVRWLHIDCGEVPEGKSRIYVFKP
jgi:hypothetical protein